MPAMRASVPGQFSHETVSCVVLGIWEPPRGESADATRPVSRGQRQRSVHLLSARGGFTASLTGARQNPQSRLQYFGLLWFDLLTTKGSLPHNGTSRGADTQDRKVMEVLP